jgi:hypothetical protein
MRREDERILKTGSILSWPEMSVDGFGRDSKTLPRCFDVSMPRQWPAERVRVAGQENPEIKDVARRLKESVQLGGLLLLGDVLIVVTSPSPHP